MINSSPWDGNQLLLFQEENSRISFTNSGNQQKVFSVLSFVLQLKGGVLVMCDAQIQVRFFNCISARCKIEMEVPQYVIVMSWHSHANVVYSGVQFRNSGLILMLLMSILLMFLYLFQLIWWCFLSIYEIYNHKRLDY